MTAPRFPPFESLSHFIEPVYALATEAGRAIVEIYRTRQFTVTEKTDRSPLTEADQVAHDILCNGLKDLTPTIPILSEEDDEVDFAIRRYWEWLWLVDPLDGTREFIRRNDQFSVNIALVYRQVAVFGLIYIPVGGECYFAYQAGGAYKQIPHEQPTVIHTRTLSIPPVITCSRAAYGAEPLRSYLRQLQTHLGEYRHIAVGSALKSCLIAEGAVDFYPRFGPTGEWDTAAAQIIVEEAGGRLTNTQMQPLLYNARPTLINPDFFVAGDPHHNWSHYLQFDSHVDGSRHDNTLTTLSSSTPTE